MGEREGRAKNIGAARRFGMRALVSGGTLAVLFVGAEIFARLQSGEEQQDAETSFVVPDAQLLWRLAPTASGPFATNELGFRDGPHRADAELTILLLGDSVAWGDGVRDRTACFPSLLEASLRDDRGGGDVEVINAAVPGWATFQQRDYLKLEGLGLNPDLVLLQVCLNDVTKRYRVLAQYGGGDHFLGIDTRDVVPGLHGWLLSHSAAYRVLGRELTRRARDREAYTVKKLCRPEWGPELTEAWGLFESELLQVIEVARSAGLPIAVMLTPYRFQLSDPKGTRRPQEQMAKLLGAHGVPFLDLLPHLAPLGDDMLRDPSHLSLRGHMAATRVMASWLGKAL